MNTMDNLALFYDISYEEISTPNNRYELELEIASYMENTTIDTTYNNDIELFAKLERKLNDLCNDYRLLYWDIQLIDNVFEVNVVQFQIKLQLPNINDIVILNMCIRYG